MNSPLKLRACQVTFVLLAFAVATGHCELEPLTRHNVTNGGAGLGIYDGTPTTIEKHPYLVGILFENEFFCAGAIVSDSWLVTLADCVLNSTSDYKVVAASSDGVTGKTYQVQTITIHPKFTGFVDYNFACVQIKGKFEWSSKTKPTQLPKKAPKANTDMVVAGWGATSAEDKSALLQGNMKWLGLKTCKADVPFPFWTSRLACAYNKGKTTLCSGDWGDAFIYNDVFYGMFLASASTGFCSSEALPVVLADIHSVSPWIAKVTGAKYEDD